MLPDVAAEFPTKTLTNFTSAHVEKNTKNTPILKQFLVCIILWHCVDAKTKSPYYFIIKLFKIEIPAL